MGKIQFQGLLPLMMFCALIIARLCFGQDEEISYTPAKSPVSSYPKTSLGIIIGRKQYFGFVDPWQPKEIFTTYGILVNLDIYRAIHLNLCYNYWPAHYLCPDINHFNEILFYKEHRLTVESEYKYDFLFNSLYLKSGMGLLFNYTIKEVSDELGYRIARHLEPSTSWSIGLGCNLAKYNFPVILGFYAQYTPGIFGLIDILDGPHKSTIHSLNMNLFLGYTF